MAASALALMAGGGAATQASAATVSAVGDSFDVNYSYESLLATLTWTVTSIVGDRWSFSVFIDNNSANDGGALTNRITSFGFTTDPSATNLAVSDGWQGEITDKFFGAGYKFFDIEACVFAGPETCTGGGNGGVEGGNFDTINIAFDYGAGPLNFTSFATRWQSISVTDPDDPNGDPKTSIVIGPTPIPVPAAGFLLIGALGGLAAVRRRRRAV
jgi:hypothetical protein